MTDWNLINQNELLDARELFKVSANDVAKYIGTTRQTINNYEAGRAKITKPMQICITLYFQKLANNVKVNYYRLSPYEEDLINKFKSFRF